MRSLLLCAAAPLALAACVETAGVEGGNGLSAAENATIFDEALASLGCELRFESDYQAMEIQTGMTRENIQAVAARKVRRKQAMVLPDGGVRSTAGACANGGTPVAVAPAPVKAS